MPFLYQPKFCCNCGEKVERESWQPWTSRRFCEVCAIEQQHHELLPRAILGLAVLAGLFGLSAFVRRADPQRSVTAVQPVPVKAAPQMPANSQVSAAANGAGNNSLATAPTANTNGLAPALPAQALAKQKLNAQEPVYYCGAATKKGTPCSRRVKTAGERCWQHIGQPSIAKDAIQALRR